MLAIVTRFIHQILISIVIAKVIIVLIKLISVLFFLSIFIVIRVEVLLVAGGLTMIPVFTRKTIVI